jgi:hypothetical protein
LGFERLLRDIYPYSSEELRVEMAAKLLDEVCQGGGIMMVDDLGKLIMYSTVQILEKMGLSVTADFLMVIGE